MSFFSLSVIICTHNPRFDYLSRVLEALRNQTLPKEQWELLLVDNASKERVTQQLELAWHPNGRHIREDQLGQIFARLRGIAEAKSELLLFVDDDNVLDCDYLAQAIFIGKSWPHLGAWGGQCIPEFEVKPEVDILPHIGGLAIRSNTRDYWTNVPGPFNDAYPFGAGLCIRNYIAQRHATAVTSGSIRLSLGRRGTQLTSADDFDILLSCLEGGDGCGVFKDLRLTHLIPASRVTEDYFANLIWGHAYSNFLLFSSRGMHAVDPLNTRLAWIKFWLRSLKLSRIARRFLWAGLRGSHDAAKLWKLQNYN